jgi:hypothetical protein
MRLLRLLLWLLLWLLLLRMQRAQPDWSGAEQDQFPQSRGPGELESCAVALAA